MVKSKTITGFIQEAFHRVRSGIAGRPTKSKLEVVLPAMQKPRLGPVVAMLHRVWIPGKGKAAKRKREAEHLRILIASLPPITLSPLEKANREASRFTALAEPGIQEIAGDRMNILVRPCIRPLPVGIVKILELCHKPV